MHSKTAEGTTRKKAGGEFLLGHKNHWSRSQSEIKAPLCFHDQRARRTTVVPHHIVVSCSLADFWGFFCMKYCILRSEVGLHWVQWVFVRPLGLISAVQQFTPAACMCVCMCVNCRATEISLDRQTDTPHSV